jgi:hypothetical protein
MTVDDFLRDLGDDGFYANIFSFVLPCGIIFVPIIEYTVSNLGVLKTLHLTNALGVLFGSILFFPTLPMQLFGFAVFPCFRAFLYASLNTFIAVSFGVETMGRIIGFTFTTASVVSLLQYPAAIYGGHGHWLGCIWIMLSICIIPIGLGISYKETQITSLPSSHMQSPATQSPLLRSGRSREI